MFAPKLDYLAEHDNNLSIGEGKKCDVTVGKRCFATEEERRKLRCHNHSRINWILKHISVGTRPIEHQLSRHKGNLYLYLAMTRDSHKRRKGFNGFRFDVDLGSNLRSRSWHFPNCRSERHHTFVNVLRLAIVRKEIMMILSLSVLHKLLSRIHQNFKS